MSRKLLFKYLIFSALCCFLSAEKVIKIDGGKIAGANETNYQAYRGIPYGESPVGNLRFAAPKTYSEKWSGIKEFKNYSDFCAQYDHLEYKFKGSEDCLKLNVFVPNSVVSSEQLAPVLVYIHGGAFMFGDSNFYLPDHIMDNQNMILVTINYRLGILGFLSTEDKVIPGNFGLKDQVEALKWVNRNIKAFNGDSSRVTLVGFSAGGASVHLHYMSPLTKGLFQNGISHSGVALNPWVMAENSQQKAHKVASYMDCPKDHKKLLKCLRSKPAEDLVIQAKKFQPFLYNPFSPFGAVVEPQHKSAFLTDHPINILEKGNFKKLPWMMSLTEDEGLYPAAEFYNHHLTQINEKWDQLAPFILDFDGDTQNSQIKLEVSRKIRKFYLQNREINKQNFIAFDNIISDRIFNYHTVKAVQLQSKYSPSYCYLFRYKSLEGLTEFFGQTTDSIGIAHGEDVFLIFNHNHRSVPYSAEEITMSQSLINLYHNFANGSNPVYGNIRIEESTPDQFKTLDIFSPTSYEMSLKDEYFGKIQFWDEIEKTLKNHTKMLNDEL